MTIAAAKISAYLGTVNESKYDLVCTVAVGFFMARARLFAPETEMGMN